MGVLLGRALYLRHRITSDFDDAIVDSVIVKSTLSQKDIYRLLEEAGSRGERLVVATVAHTRGSTPQRRGAKMLFFQNGDVAGTVGGGCIEAEVWAGARDAMRTGKSQLHHYSLTADEASEEGMVCGGTMDIFVEVISP
jgi:xanthine dehydrogenase accessory factor